MTYLRIQFTDKAKSASRTYACRQTGSLGCGIADAFVHLDPNQRCLCATVALLPMICCSRSSLSCLVCCVVLAEVACSQLPACQPFRNTFQVPSVPACRQFVQLLEDPQYCSLDQGQNCCVVLDAAVASQCHCWQGFSSATVGLISLLRRHCDEQHPKEGVPSLNVKVFIGVLTGSANREQRQAGGEYAAQYGSRCAHPPVGAFVGGDLHPVSMAALQCGKPGQAKLRVTELPFSLQFPAMRHCLIFCEGDCQQGPFKFLHKLQSVSSRFYCSEPQQYSHCLLFHSSGLAATQHAVHTITIAMSTRLLLCDREAAAHQDVVVLPDIQESYFNITHQTLEMCRMAAMDPTITHLLKVDDDSYVHVIKLMGRLKALPREKMFAGYMEKAGKYVRPSWAHKSQVLMHTAEHAQHRHTSVFEHARSCLLVSQQSQAL